MLSDQYRFCHTLRVRYSEIDGQMIVFNSHYLTYCDIAVTEYLRNLGLAWSAMETLGFDFALVKSTLEYQKPAKFDDILDIYVKISSLGRKSFTTNFLITRADDQKSLVSVENIYAGFDSSSGQGIAIPDSFRSAIESFESQAALLR